jgi:hypothetical protein
VSPWGCLSLAWYEPQQEFSKQLTSSPDALKAQPGLPGGLLASHEANASSVAANITSYLYECGQSRKSTNLGDALQRSFSLKHRELSGEDCIVGEPGDEDAEGGAANKSSAGRNANKPQCWEIGVCVCSEQGAKLYHLKQRYINVSKCVFPASGNLRTSHLKMSKIFVLLRGCRVKDADEEAPRWQTQFLYHIGIHYLSPFRPTYRAVTLSGPCDADASSVPVVGTNEYSTLWPTLQKLDLDLAWFSKYYAIRESAMPLGSFQPANATMVPLQPGVGTQFWPPRRRTAARKGTGVADTAGADDLDDDPDHADDNADDNDVKADEDEQVVDKLLEDSIQAMRVAHEETPPPPDPGEAAGSDAAPPDPGPADSDSEGSSSSSSSSSSKSVRLRGTADLAVQVPGGVIRFYQNKNSFTATCCNPNHGKCVITRTALTAANEKSSNTNVIAKGRPLGFMTAWLAMSEHTADKEDHWDTDKAPNFVTRVAARNQLADIPKASALLAKERPQRAGEGPEPIGLP